MSDALDQLEAATAAAFDQMPPQAEVAAVLTLAYYRAKAAGDEMLTARLLRLLSPEGPLGGWLP